MWSIYSTLILLLCLNNCVSGQTITRERYSPGDFVIASQQGNAVIYVDDQDYTIVKISARLLAEDIERVTGKKPEVVNAIPAKSKNLIIIGSIDSSTFVKTLVAQKKISKASIQGKWEAYQIQQLSNPSKGIENAIVIMGSDRRGTAFGVFELSRQMGVSPWYWWADVPVTKKNSLYIAKGTKLSDAPKVKYRGIFINDEAPALSNWSREKFGGFNHKFYDKVFELMLRHKSNYLWPAMWGNAFYDDDSLNRKMADDYGIVIGTSHHEPLMRAHDEWRRYGGGKWNYDSNEVKLREFWRGGMQRATNEKIVSVGMRGDGDEPMTRETATALLERIVQDQRQIIEEVTGRPAAETPQLWALYKEVQDYYDKGMRVPDDVTLLLCDDNWGNIRRLPDPKEKPRKGGYGIYYHFDYVGGPRNYKWVNTNPLPRVWEQMHLAWEYKARQIWIVNVGDIKPMELPISFFLDYAWDPEKIGADDVQPYTEKWAAEQFGEEYSNQIATILSAYSKINGRRKPELLDQNTYSINTGEFEEVVMKYKYYYLVAANIYNQLPAVYRDAYFQIVLHPVKACANLNEMYYYVAMNQKEAAIKSREANKYAEYVKELYKNDSLITLEYHQLNSGKWNHMMSQTHIGYTYWQQPPRQNMPEVKLVSSDSILQVVSTIDTVPINVEATIPANAKGWVLFQHHNHVSIEANHFTRVVNTKNITWKVLPDHGRTGSALTPFPVTARRQSPIAGSPHVQYDVYVSYKGEFSLLAYFSPTLNLHNSATGLQYAISIDNEPPQIISINKEDADARTWNTWVANNIIIKKTQHKILKPGKHIVKYWMVDPCVVLQKLVLDFGEKELGYLGPEETIMYRPENNMIIRDK